MFISRHLPAREQLPPHHNCIPFSRVWADERFPLETIPDREPKVGVPSVVFTTAHFGPRSMIARGGRVSKSDVSFFARPVGRIGLP